MSMTDTNRLTVDRSTTLRDLSDYAQQLPKNSPPLRGEANEDGSITLYVKTPGTEKAKNILFGKKSTTTTSTTGNSSSSTSTSSYKSKANNRDLAREAVLKVLNNTGRALNEHVDTGYGTLGNVRGILNDPSITIRKRGLELIAESVSGSGVVRDSYDVSGPPIPSTLGTEVKQLVSEMAARAGNFSSSDTQAFAKKLSTLLKTAKGMSSGERESFALSTGDKVKNVLCDALQKELGRAIEVDVLESLVDGVVELAKEQVLDIVQNLDKSVPIEGKLYVHDGHLGKGGFGSVERYVCTYRDDKGVEQKLQVAIKTVNGTPNAPKWEQIKKNNDTARELQAHRDAQDVRGHDNILALRGTVKMLDGSVGIILEIAPHGHIGHTSDGIESARQGSFLGKKADRAVCMTMLKDIAEGLEYLQPGEEDDVAHFDLRGDNVFLGDMGVAKLADFGLGMKARDFSIPIHYNRLPKNATQGAPEALAATDAWRKVVNEKAKKDTNYSDTLASAVEQFGEGKRDELVRNIRKNQAYTDASKNPALQVSARTVDSWSFGALAFEMLQGRPPVDSKDEFQIKGRYQDFINPEKTKGLSANERFAINPERNDREEQTTILKSRADEEADWESKMRNGIHPGDVLKVKDPRAKGAFGGSTGLKETDDLLNKLMHPISTQRPNMSTALREPAFDLDGVGSVEARQLGMKLTALGRMENGLRPNLAREKLEVRLVAQREVEQQLNAETDPQSRIDNEKRRNNLPELIRDTQTGIDKLILDHPKMPRTREENVKLIQSTNDSIQKLRIEIKALSDKIDQDGFSRTKPDAARRRAVGTESLEEYVPIGLGSRPPGYAPPSLPNSSNSSSSFSSTTDVRPPREHQGFMGGLPHSTSGEAPKINSTVDTSTTTTNTTVTTVTSTTTETSTVQMTIAPTGLGPPGGGVTSQDGRRSDVSTDLPLEGANTSNTNLGGGPLPLPPPPPPLSRVEVLKRELEEAIAAANLTTRSQGTRRQ